MLLYVVPTDGNQKEKREEEPVHTCIFSLTIFLQIRLLPRKNLLPLNVVNM